MKTIATACLALGLAGCGAAVAQPPGQDAGMTAMPEGGGPAEAGCPGTLASCATGCVDTLTDPKNCGGCGQGCATTQTCVSGTCVTPCTGAGHAMCAGTCVDEDTDVTHCGSCTHACTDTQVCLAGVCTADPCAQFPDCVTCTPNAACGWCLTTNSCDSTSRENTCDFWSYGTC